MLVQCSHGNQSIARRTAPRITYISRTPPRTWLLEELPTSADRDNYFTKHPNCSPLRLPHSTYPLSRIRLSQTSPPVSNIRVKAFSDAASQNCNVLIRELLLSIPGACAIPMPLHTCESKECVSG